MTTFTFKAPKAGTYTWQCLGNCDSWAMNHLGFVKGASRYRPEAAATLPRTYGGDQVSTWSVLRQSCKRRSPVGLLNQPGHKASANDNLALAA